MRNQHGGSLVGVDTLAFERNQAGRAAVQQDWRVLTSLHDDAGLQASAASERVTGSGEGHRHRAIAGCRHRTHQTSVADRIPAHGLGARSLLIEIENTYYALRRPAAR